MPRLIAASVCIALILGAAAAAPGTAGAQTGGEKTPVPHHSVLSTNPILDLFTWYNLELEHRVSDTGTIGVGGSFITTNDGDNDYLSGNLFYRYYPQQAALSGFFLGGRVGASSIQTLASSIDSGTGKLTEKKEKATYFSIGIDVGYNWLLGSSRRTYISLGIGAVRLFGGDLDEVALTLPTIRLINIGIAF